MAFTLARGFCSIMKGPGAAANSSRGRFRRRSLGSSWAWPASCGCGYAFGPNDDRRLFQDRLYRNPETGTLYTSATIPPGALWAAPWLFWKGPDEQCLLLQTPGGPWIADAPQEGLPITRSGFPPLVTVDGPIIAGAFHGELRDGVLIGALTSESESY